MRNGKINRKTKETDIQVELNIDGDGQGELKTGLNFLNHMLEQFVKYSMFDVKLNAKGDLQIDEHHTVEDCGIVLGRALQQALGDKRGIRRFASAYAPLDEALALAVIDINGRGGFYFDCNFSRKKVGDLSTELIYDFFEAFARSANVTVHLRLLTGRNDHHKIESLFKAFGLAMRTACELDERRKEIPSTKGVI